MSDTLFDRNIDYDDIAYRNIVGLRQSEDLFDDLIPPDIADRDLARQAAVEAEMRVKANIPADTTSRAFQYSTAIAWPFEHEPFMASRYADGSFPVWYGSPELETTIFETAWHMHLFESGVEREPEPVIRERAVYQIQCRALLVDLSRKAKKHPLLIADDYTYTQQIGKRLATEGHPGILAPSARHAGHFNLVLFQKERLSAPKLLCYLTYRYDPEQRQISVEREEGSQWFQIDF